VKIINAQNGHSHKLLNKCRSSFECIDFPYSQYYLEKWDAVLPGEVE